MIGIDIKEKEKFMKSCGAEVTLAIDQFPKDDNAAGITQEIMRLTDGKRAAATVICSDSNAAYAQGLGFLRFNGIMVCVGVPGGKTAVVGNAYPSVMISKRLAIVGSTVGNRKDALEKLDMAKRGVVVTHISTEEVCNLDAVFHDLHTENSREGL